MSPNVLILLILFFTLIIRHVFLWLITLEHNIHKGKYKIWDLQGDLVTLVLNNKIPRDTTTELLHTLCTDSVKVIKCLTVYPLSLQRVAQAIEKEKMYFRILYIAKEAVDYRTNRRQFVEDFLFIFSSTLIKNSLLLRIYLRICAKKPQFETYVKNKIPWLHQIGEIVQMCQYGIRHLRHTQKLKARSKKR